MPIFGPVPSRRLGRSLGIDVIPPKTCSFDCIYCESGATTHLTIERRLFHPPERILAELDDFFARHTGGADALTFSSAGEPTLYLGLGELIARVKERYPKLPLVVLTNGSLFWDPGVRRDLLLADRVVPSLDAVTVESFRKINRPHPKLDLEQIIEGIRAFRREYTGRMHVEVVLVSGVNDRPEELTLARRIIDTLGADQIELNTVVRPPAVRGCRGLGPEAMALAATFFPPEKTLVIGHYSGPSESAGQGDLAERIVSMVKRRPCTETEMASSLGANPKDVSAAVQRLASEGRVSRVRFDDRDFVEARG